MLNHKLNQKTNVLIILTDQQRHDAVGYQNPKILTPNIDRLAKDGTVCSTTVCQSPQCQPSRASILTGRYPNTLKMWWNEISLSRDEKTVGNYLSDKGYHTGYFGKLHIDGKGNHTQIAEHFGFQHSYLSEDWQYLINSEHWETEHRGSNRVREEFYGTMRKAPWVGRFTDRRLHHDDVVTEKAATFMQETFDPFFCMVGFHGPHPPYAAPDPFNDMYDPTSFDVPKKMLQCLNGDMMTTDLWQNLKAQYYGSVSWIDDNVGKLVKAAGDNTIIVFTSDHGDILGDHNLFSKGLYAFEGNTLVPLVFKFPWRDPTVYPHIVQSIDIVPTLLNALGVERHSGIQGKNLCGAFEQGKVVNKWALSMIGCDQRLRMIRTDKAKYWHFNGDEYLFDLVKDPDELENLAGRRSHLSKLQDLRFLLLKGLIASEDCLPFPRKV